MKVHKNHKKNSVINWVRKHKFVSFLGLTLVLVGLSILIQQLTPDLNSPSTPYLSKASKNLVENLKPGSTLSETDKKRLGVVSSKTKNGQTYLFLSPRETVKNDLIVVNENQEILFTRTNLAYNPNSNIKDYLKKLGDPDMVMSAPKISSAVYVYVFLNQGVAVVAHKQTGLVEQVWRFKPMSKELFLATWGKDLKPKDAPTAPDELPL